MCRVCMHVGRFLSDMLFYTAQAWTAAVCSRYAAGADCALFIFTGEVNMVPSYVGSLWLLEANSAPIKLLNPKKLMKVTELDTTTYERYVV